MTDTSRRTIACVTGTRADYPRVKSVLREIVARPNLDLRLIVTGAHLSKAFGYTITEIEADGFEIAEKFEIYDEDDTPYGMAKAAARCAEGTAHALKRIDPDIVLITVDRMETLAATQSAALMNFPIAHVQGGEVTGTIDESIRHAVTKLSHIHFPASPDAAERIVKMGEDPRHVHQVGCPYLDIITGLEYKSKAEMAAKYGFDADKPLVLFTQHPVTTEFGEGGEQVKKTIEALNGFPDVEVFALYSNTDAGGREIVEIMKQQSRYKIFPNIDSADFLNIMKHADLMLGNSSAGIREAPSFELPVVNVGSRQQGRERAANVIDVPHEVGAIREAIRKGLSKPFRDSLKGVVNPYGDGKSAKRIVDILESVTIDRDLVQKIIHY